MTAKSGGTLILDEIVFAYDKEKGEAFLRRLLGRKPLFTCVIGTTETAKIPGISAAGKNPEITHYTPPADVELLLLGRCECIPSVPVTPEGIPTPALITRAALKLAEIPAIVVSGGLKVRPQVPFIELGGSPGKDIRTGNAVDNAGKVMEKAIIVGENLAKTVDYLVVGESVPGGTTTALGVLLAMGVAAEGKVSSSMPSNPHKLKIETVKAGLEASNIKFGALANNPLKAISCVGDPVMPAFAGLVMGAAGEVPVLMAGGTQMSAILAIIKALKPEVLDNLAIGTTRWIISDKKADIVSLVKQIAPVPVLAVNLDFSSSKFEGLKAYEAGAVKEGVGAGGACIAAILKSRGAISTGEIFVEIEKAYSQLIHSDLR
ncbi:MAG: TIGR00303 family protein [Nitrososphaerota archaeon]|nr:TIGR00303 family protein [Nitrososphaerota archaeon]